MKSAANFDMYEKPYCRCCGSLEVMTVDVSIEESSDWAQQSRLRKERLWKAIRSLEEYELNEFILDAVPYCNLDEDHEVESGLTFYLMENPYRYGGDASGPIREVDLDTIVVPWDDHIRKERKRAFIRLWESFDEKSKASFLARYLRHDGSTGEVSR